MSVQRRRISRFFSRDKDVGEAIAAKSNVEKMSESPKSEEKDKVCVEGRDVTVTNCCEEATNWFDTEVRFGHIDDPCTINKPDTIYLDRYHKRTTLVICCFLSTRHSVTGRCYHCLPQVLEKGEKAISLDAEWMPPWFRGDEDEKICVLQVHIDKEVA